MDWKLVVLGYLVIGVVQLLYFEHFFLKRYRADIYELAESELPPMLPDLFLRIGFAVTIVLLWLPLDVIALVQWLGRKVGHSEKSETQLSLEDKLRDRQDELQALEKSKKRREHYLKAIAKAKRLKEEDRE